MSTWPGSPRSPAQVPPSLLPADRGLFLEMRRIYTGQGPQVKATQDSHGGCRGAGVYVPPRAQGLKEEPEEPQMSPQPRTMTKVAPKRAQ